MENYCAFSKNHTCLKWLDYVITRQELEEATLSVTETGQRFNARTNTFRPYMRFWTAITSHTPMKYSLI